MRLPRIILASFLILALAACSIFQPDPPPIVIACPQVKFWSVEEQANILAAYEGLPANSILRPVVRDWISLHRQGMACKTT